MKQEAICIIVAALGLIAADGKEQLIILKLDKRTFKNFNFYEFFFYIFLKKLELGLSKIVLKILHVSWLK